MVNSTNNEKNIETSIIKKIGYTVLIFILILSFFKLIIPKSNQKKDLNELKKFTKPQFDSLNMRMRMDRDFQEGLLNLINAKKLDSAQKILDSLNNLGLKKRQFLVYQGMIFYYRYQYSKAIEQYNDAIEEYNIDYPLALSKRGQAYLKLNKFSEAINDYRKAIPFYEYLNCDLALTFELNHQMDSAIFYYKKYLVEYPERNDIRDHLNKLISIPK